MNTADALIRDGLPASVLARIPLPPLDPAARLREVWIATRIDGLPFDPLNPIIEGDGTQLNPWDGSTAIRLDYILGVLLVDATDILIHFGPDCTFPPLSYQSCTNFKAFNNQQTNGTLLRAYNSATSCYLMELQDFIEDALLGF